MAISRICTATLELGRESKTLGWTRPGHPNPREFLSAATLPGEAGQSLRTEGLQQLSPSQETSSGDPPFPGKMETGSARPR